jgi:hypothetical protein
LTGDRIARRLGLGQLKRLDPPPPAVRYQRERPGELVHLDTKKLGRIEASAIASPVAGREQSTAITASAGRRCMWRSTMLRGSPTPNSCRTRRKKPPDPPLGLDRPDLDRDSADQLVSRLPAAWYPDLFGRKEYLTEVSLSGQRGKYALGKRVVLAYSRGNDDARLG